MNNDFQRVLRMYRAGGCVLSDVYIICIRNIHDPSLAQLLASMGDQGYRKFVDWGRSFALEEGATILGAGIGVMVTDQEMSDFRSWLLIQE